MCSFGLDAPAPQEYTQTVEEEEEESPNYEEKAHEIVQSILQEVVNTVAGGELVFFSKDKTGRKLIKSLDSLVFFFWFFLHAITFALQPLQLPLWA